MTARRRHTSPPSNAPTPPLDGRQPAPPPGVPTPPLGRRPAAEPGAPTPPLGGRPPVTPPDAPTQSLSRRPAPADQVDQTTAAYRAFLHATQQVVSRLAADPDLPVQPAIVAAARFLRLLEGNEIILRSELEEAVFNDSVVFGRWGRPGEKGTNLISHALAADGYSDEEKAVLRTMNNDRLGCFVCAPADEAPLLLGHDLYDSREITIFDYGLFGSLQAGQALFARFLPFQPGRWSTTGFAFAFNLSADEIKSRIAALAAREGLTPTPDRHLPLFLLLHRECGLKTVAD